MISRKDAKIAKTGQLDGRGMLAMGLPPKGPLFRGVVPEKA